MNKKINIFSKIIFLLILTFFSFNVFSKNQKKSKEESTATKSQEKTFDLQNLLENFNQYKTTNSFHSGNLLQHSTWTANTVLNWFEQDDQWVKDIDKKDQKLAFISALLHDVGKSGDLNFTFYTKPNHAQLGFEYLMDQKEYLLDKNKKFDFQKMFESLGITTEDQKLICILVGIHEVFGKEILAKYNKNSTLLFEHFLIALESLAKKANYKSGKIDTRLLRLAILISAADVKGAQKTTCSKDVLSKYLKEFNLNLKQELFESTPEKIDKNKKSMYNKFDFENKGKKLRNELIYYLIKRSNKENIKSYVNSIENWISGT